jgi:hypothetical protein
VHPALCGLHEEVLADPIIQEVGKRELAKEKIIQDPGVMPGLLSLGSCAREG